MKHFSVMVGIVLTGLLLLLSTTFAVHGGGLWRDEANSAAMAENLPSIHWTDLQYDSFPAAWFGILRGWILLAGHADESYRLFGLVISMSVIAIVWIVARIEDAHVPLITLILMLNGAVIWTLSTVRAYGVSILAVLLLVVAVLRLLKQRAAGRHVGVLLFSLLAAHLLYLNCVVVFSVLCAAAWALARNSRRGDAVLVLMWGAISAMSLLIYLPIIRASQEWIVALQTKYNAGIFFERIFQTITFAGNGALALWLVIIGVALIAGTRAVWLRGCPHHTFAAALLVLLVPTYLLFLQYIHLITSWWYYVPLLVAVASACDLVLHFALREVRWRRIAIGCVVVAPLFVAPAMEICSARQTNMDSVAAVVGRMASKRDLVIVEPWPFGVSYSRYHHALAPWQTVPPLSEHRWHRWDQEARCVTDGGMLTPLLRAIDGTLKEGGRVFVITGWRLSFFPSNPSTRTSSLADARLNWRSRVAHELTVDGARPVLLEQVGTNVRSLERPFLQVWTASEGSIVRPRRTSR